jgi:ATP phosphoribosyltransferase regulatory subunit
LHGVHDLLVAHGVSARVNLDLGAVRDFDYYTGIIFEVFSPGLGAPLAAGGRYDGLLERFGQARAATGVVVFLDRVQSVLNVSSGIAKPDLVLVGFEAEAAAAVRLAASLRQAGSTVIMEVTPTGEGELRRRAAEVGAERVVLCAAEQLWLLDADGRRAFDSAP